MAIEVFNRYENKYILDTQTFDLFEQRLGEHMRLDQYNKINHTYQICNIYYDTFDSRLIRNSLKKPNYKEKLRLRTYGIPDEDSPVYVEIKKKVCGLVNKRRSEMRVDEAYKFLEEGHISDDELKYYMNRQVLREIEFMLSRNTLMPMLYLAYERRAYFGISDYDLRISFDTEIVSRRHDIKLESGKYGELLLPGDKWLMEIKVANSIPVWLTRLLSEFEIRPTSFSKYGHEYVSSGLAANIAAKTSENPGFVASVQTSPKKIIIPA